MKIGITGQAGFVGTWLYNTLGLYPLFIRIPFQDSFFDNKTKLQSFVSECDVIVHLAAVNRHSSPEVIYNTNINLVKLLIEAMDNEGVKPHILFASSTQEERDNMYGKSKKEGRQMLANWAEKRGASFTGLVIPNVYGPFSKPDYNTFIATFAHRLINGQPPVIDVDNSVKLIYVASLCQFIIKRVLEKEDKIAHSVTVPNDLESTVTEVLEKLQYFNNLYLNQGVIPVLNDINDINLFNTYRSYIDYPRHFPVLLEKKSDSRGTFVETVKFGAGGQVSFSTTAPGITRGNHFHTRKIERFTVIKGKAVIKLRKIGTNEVTELYLDGQNPSYVDMPVWYTHNITNIGNEDLYTQFWINEWYNPQDSDTYFEEV